MNTWQLCPKCNGQGTNYNHQATSTSCICDLCNGHKVISIFTGKPPQQSSVSTAITNLEHLQPFEGDILTKQPNKNEFFINVPDSDKAV